MNDVAIATVIKPNRDLMKFVIREFQKLNFSFPLVYQPEKFVFTSSFTGYNSLSSLSSLLANENVSS